MCGVPALLSRNPTLVAWAPVVLMPPLLILDSALSSNDDKPGVTLLGGRNWWAPRPLRRLHAGLPGLR